MILLRFNKLEGKYCDIQGGQEKYGYGKSNAGWFPIEGMNFGFRSTSESTVGNKNTEGDQQNGSGTPPANQNRGTPVGGGTGSGGAKKESEEAFTTISISKYVDGVTTSLMAFAMQDRIVTKSERSKMRQADIHFLHSVMGDPSKKSNRYIFPYLMVTLDHVLVKGWNISAQSDDRPTESLELWYDKAAMRYYRTVDGRTWIGGDVTGWDQYKNDEWVIPKGGEPMYFKEPDNR